MPKDPKLQAIKVAMEQIEKQYGAGSIMRLGEQQHTDIAFIPTGSPALDIALGIGGLP
ncbi:TPA: DNA recombination/repair protein RecA, partial [Candidatus Beckwithbacteria bacterium]|nr:DNA recombination/repair protein RecA [Candidatus Beckwithbacteria bacterium]